MLDHSLLFNALRDDLVNLWGMQPDIVVGLIRWFHPEGKDYVARVSEWQLFLSAGTGNPSCGPLLVRAKAARVWGCGYALSDDTSRVAAVHQIAMLFWKEEVSVPPDWNAYACRMTCSGTPDIDHPLIGKLAERIKMILGKAPQWDDIQMCMGSGATADRRDKRDRWCFDHRPLGIPSSWYSYNVHDTTQFTTDVVPTARAAAVAKNRKSCRIVASEPSACISAQLGLMLATEDRLQRYFRNRVPIHNADVHRRFLVRHHTDAVTVDLSDASDYISMDLMACILPPDWFDMFCSCRSQAVRLPDGSVHRLATFAPMGNGYCFRTLSLVCAAIMDLCCKSCYSDFGDDMIVMNKDYSAVATLLQACGLVINEGKTCSGRYLETCGLELLDGVNITPLKIKRLLMFKGRYADICAAQSAASRNLRKLGDALMAVRDFPQRYNRRYQRIEYRVPMWVSRDYEVGCDGWPGLLRWFAQRGTRYRNEVSQYTRTWPGFGWVSSLSEAAEAFASAQQDKFE